MKTIAIDLARVDLFTADPDQPTCCPECGGRTEFEEVDISGCTNAESINPEGFQRHLCLNHLCELHTQPFFTEFEKVQPHGRALGGKASHTDHYLVFIGEPEKAKEFYEQVVGLNSTVTASVAVVSRSTDYNAYDPYYPQDATLIVAYTTDEDIEDE